MDESVVTTGNLSKMVVKLDTPVDYRLPLGDELISLNQYLGKKITLHHTGNIHCTACGRKTKKSYSQGYCFPCTQRLAQCDICIVRPEKCHIDAGTCREPDWAQDHCMRPHVVYIANASGLKVGITRATQIPTRWIDQGAGQALPLITVQSRQQVGVIEVGLKSYIADKTDWRKMLKGVAETVDLAKAGQHLLEQGGEVVENAKKQFGDDAIQEMPDAQVVTIEYPVSEYPDKVASFNFDKTATVEGVLVGIKGQYLIFDKGVINIRKFTGYEICFNAA